MESKIAPFLIAGKENIVSEEIKKILSAKTYCENKNYKITDCANHNGDIYRCKTDTTGQWNPNHWEIVPILTI